MCRFHVMRALLTLTLYRAWTRWSPKKRSSCSCRTESASTQTVKGSFQHRVFIQSSVAHWCRLIFPSICSKTEILFENQIVFISKFFFENRGLTVKLSTRWQTCSIVVGDLVNQLQTALESCFLGLVVTR